MTNDNSKLFRVWLTLAVTPVNSEKSLLMTWAEIDECYRDGSIIVDLQDCRGYVFKGNEEGETWHRTRESAIARALVMREKRIAYIRELITEVEALDAEKLLPED